MSDEKQASHSYFPDERGAGHAGHPGAAWIDVDDQADDTDEFMLQPGDPADSHTAFHRVAMSEATHFGLHEVFAENGKDNMLVGAGEADQLNGGNGDDVLIGKAGDDREFGEEGEDILYGDRGRDYLYGGKGRDILLGGDDDDELEGGPGPDVLNGGPGADVLAGGMGDDVLKGGSGNDLLRGEGGSDTYEFDRGDGADIISNYDRHMPDGYAGGDRDQVLYGAGITSDQLWWQRAGTDLTVTNLDTGDSQTITGWYQSPAFRIDTFILANGSQLSADGAEALVSAMATMAMPPVGAGPIPAALHHALQPVLAHSWQ
ncbi:calcium-binding protein [Herbaspirillum sp. YR522]|uniref:calcium-binding protein n=1 Tax=Herbaspirillum sp. YR522 TaxID=1144342 RepID=UPI00026FC458|nr:calcium-binding protein [Herbaspirillum sp. YR522]EJN09577.1 putative calcium-binding protein [Herbaspirillum sp. YR522]